MYIRYVRGLAAFSWLGQKVKDRRNYFFTRILQVGLISEWE